MEMSTLELRLPIRSIRFIVLNVHFVRVLVEVAGVQLVLDLGDNTRAKLALNQLIPVETLEEWMLQRRKGEEITATDKK
jgi:hypothetical protein